jgi:hypothetical protein
MQLQENHEIVSGKMKSKWSQKTIDWDHIFWLVMLYSTAGSAYCLKRKEKNR